MNSVERSDATYYSALLRLAAVIHWRKTGTAPGGSFYASGYFRSRLSDFDRALKKLVSPKIGRRLMRRTTCYACGKHEKDEKNSQLTIDHVVPRNGHGKDSAENAALSCGRCNSSKNDLDLLVWWAKMNRNLWDLDLDVLTVYVRNMYRLLEEEGRLYEDAPGQIRFLIDCFATTLPSDGHTEAFLQISASGVVQLSLEPLVLL